MDIINWLKMKKKCQRTQRRVAKCRRNVPYNFCVNKLNEIIKCLTLFIIAGFEMCIDVLCFKGKQNKV